MLFIFGFNASWMRLNKLNQLIHNSSTSTGNNKAAVEVHFKKLLELPNGELVEVPGFELWIRRTVNSSSVSKYYLQGHESTQAEVKDKLKAEGIDLGNNRFLILQGEVEQISQMKQKSGDRDKPGLLEYLEEIIGSGLYIERIEECGREYAQAEEQKHEKGQLMKLV
jgi:structural maintenance of chromosome 4